MEQTSAVRWGIQVLVALLEVAGALDGWLALSTDAATTNLMRAKVATALTDGLQDVAVDGPRVLVTNGAGPRYYAPLIDGHPEVAFVVYKDALGELNQDLSVPPFKLTAISLYSDYVTRIDAQVFGDGQGLVGGRLASRPGTGTARTPLGYAQ